MASEAPIWDFTEHEDEPLDLVGAVFQAIGGASTCWASLDGTGEFQSDKAKVIAERLIEWIRAHSRLVSDEPLLGLATTRQLLAELTARIEVDGRLDYRTVDSG